MAKEGFKIIKNPKLIAPFVSLPETEQKITELHSIKLDNKNQALF